MANNVSVLDSASAAKVFKTTDNSNVHTSHVNVDALPAITGSVSVSNLPGTQSVSGTVAVSNFPATQPVSISGSIPVTGTFYQATQPVSISGTVPVSGTFFQATQPVSAASLPLPSGAATSANQTTQNGHLATLAGTVTNSILKTSDADTVPLANFVNGSIVNTDGASTAVIAAQGSGVITYLTDVTIQNTSAAGVLVEIKDGATVKWRVWAGADGGGITHRFATPLAGTANTAWNIDAGAATTSIYASMAGFKV